MEFTDLALTLSLLTCSTFLYFTFYPPLPVICDFSELINCTLEFFS